MSFAPSSASPKVSEGDRLTGAVQALQAGPTASRPTYYGVQVLRAVAALMVVGHHATIMLWERDHLPVPNWIAGSSGVDLFFVISGFVMMISTGPLRRAPHAARTFLARRLERIVPLYWVVTTVKVVLLLLVPAIGLNGLEGWHHVWTSYLFWPSLSPEGRFEPVLVVGWTLNFEMGFYLLFAAALALRWRPLALLGPILLLVPLIPALWLGHVPLALSFYHSTQLWEFLMGMLLGLGVQQVSKLPASLGALLVLVCMWPLLTWNLPGVDLGRGWMWGLPAAGVVLGALALEARWGRRSPRWLLLLGDASYSIYLVHTLVLPAIGLGVARIARPWPDEIPMALMVSVILSALAGVAVYRWIERPMLNWVRGWRQTAVPVVN